MIQTKDQILKNSWANYTIPLWPQAFSWSHASILYIQDGLFQRAT